MKCYIPILIFATVPALGQNNSFDLLQPTFASPNASSLGKYGEIPVGYYSGVPDINIPIYEVVEGDIVLPISLSYHASGIKVEDVSSWAGIGWTLNAGGMIGAEIRGMEDLRGPTTDISGFVERGILSSMYSPTSWAQRILSESDYTDPADIQVLREIRDGQRDGESDIYFMSAANIACKFFADNDGDFMMMPYQNVKIERDVTENRWTIIDSKGIKYRFGNHYETSTDDSGTAYATRISAWLIDEIEDLNGNIMTFHYTSYLSHAYSMSETKGALMEAAGNFQIERFNQGVQRRHLLLRGQRLDSIVATSGTKVVFHSSGSREDQEYEFSLDSIVFFNSFNERFKAAHFYHSYFSGINSPPFSFENDVFPNSNSAKRLRLDSVLIDDRLYGFGYDNTPLPTRYSIDQDLWGYYNAAGNSIFVPYYFDRVGPDQYVTFEGGNRTSNPDVMQAGVLKKIIHPTGGYTAFEYEPNMIRDKLLNGCPASVILKDTSFTIPFSNLSTCIAPFYSETFHYRLGSLPPRFQVTVLIEGINWQDNLWMELVDAATLGNVYSQRISNVYDPNLPPSLEPPPGKYKVKFCGAPGAYLLHLFWKTPNADLTDGEALVNKVVGGLRVKSITNVSNDSEIAEYISYKYTHESDPTLSSGAIVSYPVTYRDYFTITHSNSSGGSGPCVLIPGIGSAHYKIYTSFSNIPLALNNTSYVGYSTVTEERGINGTGGKTVYNFTNVNSDPDIKVDPDWDWPLTPYTSLSWNRGLLLERKTFKNESGQPVLISSLTNYYSKNSSWYDVSRRCVNIKAIPYYNVKWILQGACGPSQVSNNTAWRPYLTVSGWSELDSAIERTFSNGQELKKVFHYKHSDPNWQNYHSIIETLTINSEGDGLKIVYKYPLDFADLTATSNEVSGIKFLQEAHVTDRIVEEMSYRKDILDTEFRLTYSKYTEFYPDMAVPRYIFETESDLPIAGFIPAYTSGGSLHKDTRYYKLKTIFGKYSQKGRVLEVNRNEDKKYAYVWGYDGQYAIAQAENASENQIYHTSFELDGQVGTAVTGKRYLNSGIFAIPFTPPGDGKIYVMSYWYFANSKWNFSGVLPFTNSINSGSRLDEIRVYPSDAMMTTYTYIPGVGMASATDKNSVTTYYEYDSFNRLKCIRDSDRNILRAFHYHFTTNRN